VHKGEVDHPVRRNGCTAQALHIIEVAKKRLDPFGGQFLRCRFRPRQRGDRMSGPHQFFRDCRSDKTCCTRNKDSHVISPFLCPTDSGPWFDGLFPIH